MGDTSKKKNKKKHLEDTTDDSSTSLSERSSDDSEPSSRSRRSHRRRSDGRSRRDKDRRERDDKRKRRREKIVRDRNKRKLAREDNKGKKKKRVYKSDASDVSQSESSGGYDSESDRTRIPSQVVLRGLLKEFPNAGNDLKQLLRMIDNGQAVDIKGISEKSLVRHLKKLFLSLGLKENVDGLFLLPSNACPTLEIVEPLIDNSTEVKDHDLDDSMPFEDGLPERIRVVVGGLLKEFSNVGNDLKQLLQMIDNGQAVDIKGIPEKSLVKHLKKLFLSLGLEENSGVFLLPSRAGPTLEVVGPLIDTLNEVKGDQFDGSVLSDDARPVLGAERRKITEDNNTTSLEDDAPGPRRRVIGPAMPSAELLAAAAKLTEAQAELRDVELEEDTELFIGPAPPAMVSEAESANEAERFEEVTRIMDTDAASPYDIIGLNRNMSADNIKKRYWKLSLLVHPDKCSHPQAHQAFIKLNKAFKELQDPDKRKALDDKMKMKEEQEEMKVEMKAMREAAQWRQSQGISMEGDDELLAQMDVKVASQRDEWMTTLPPERKPASGMTMQTTKFSRASKEGRGDTSMWTDTPSDRAQKAKTNYLEAYNEAAALASNEVKKSLDAELVDKYNKEKRSKSLVEKHQEATSRPKKKSIKQRKEKEDWVGQHPWKPWDREKDLTAGRQNVKLDSDGMAQGLTSRFSSGSFQRSFL